MKLTLAMGLQYDPNPGSNFLSSGREGISTTSKSIEPVIDVEAISVEPSKTEISPIEIKKFEYLAYNLRAGLVFLPIIGSQLNMTI